MPDELNDAVAQVKSGKINPTVLGVVVLSIIFLIQAGLLPSKGDLDEHERRMDGLKIELVETRAALDRFQAVYDERESHGER